MWCRAELPCRLPPLLSRCRLVLPLEAGMGQAPQSLVGRGLAADAFGIVPATMARVAAVTVLAQ